MQHCIDLLMYSYASEKIKKKNILNLYSYETKKSITSNDCTCPWMIQGKKGNYHLYYLLPMVTFTMSSATPPRFRASHLYNPSSLSVTSVRTNIAFFSSSRRVLFLYQTTRGLGEPALMAQVRLTLSPSRMAWFGPNNWTSGRTKIGKDTRNYNERCLRKVSRWTILNIKSGACPPAWRILNHGSLSYKGSIEIIKNKLLASEDILC